MPAYTKGEEIMNMTTHIVGGAFGVFALVMCLIKSARLENPLAILASIIYGFSVILTYSMSSIYHGLAHGTSKKVFQILDHCAIFCMIAGCYTPIALVSMFPLFPTLSIVVVILQWSLAAVCITLTAIDVKKYQAFSMICYMFMGWMVMFFFPKACQVLGQTGIIYLFAGGVAYTVGAIFYGVGKKKKYMHAVWHLFILLGSVLQFISIYMYALH